MTQNAPTTPHIHDENCGCTTRRRILVQGSATVAAAVALAGCEENLLGRNTLQIVSDEQMEAAAAQAWSELKATAPISRDANMNGIVQQVGRDMVRVSQVGGSPEFIVIDDPSPNAFVLPGAKVAVLSGMFSVLGSIDELAAVLGHEMAHVTLKHANERASQQGLANLAIGAITNGGEKKALAQALGIGATLGLILPYNRKQELEADRLGVRYSHAGGYDPRAALSLWDKMGALGGSRPPEILSTHPGAGDRKAVIQAEINRLGV